MDSDLTPFAADAARHELARDIHDGPQQRLVGALINLQLAEQCFDRDPDRARRLLGDAGGYVQQGLDDLRVLSADLYPAVLATCDLPTAVSTLARTSTTPAAKHAT
jgi:signal transduction histidine kinase